MSASDAYPEEAPFPPQHMTVQVTIPDDLKRRFEEAIRRFADEQVRRAKTMRPLQVGDDTKDETTWALSDASESRSSDSSRRRYPSTPDAYAQMRADCTADIVSVLDIPADYMTAARCKQLADVLDGFATLVGLLSEDLTENR